MKRKRKAVNRGNLTVEIQTHIDRLQNTLVEMGSKRYPNSAVGHLLVNGIVGGVVMQIQALTHLAESFGIHSRYDEPTHIKDTDCTVDPATGCCLGCGVEHSEPCPECGRRAFHTATCGLVENGYTHSTAREK